MLKRFLWIVLQIALTYVFVFHARPIRTFLLGPEHTLVERDICLTVYFDQTCHVYRTGNPQCCINISGVDSFVLAGFIMGLCLVCTVLNAVFRFLKGIK
jgi:hypothetical protein